MSSPWGALIGAGASFGSGIAGKHGYNKSRRANRSRFERSLGQWRNIIDSRYPMVEATLRESMGEATQGYDKAMMETSNIGEASRQRLTERGQAAEGQMMQSLAGRGIINTSIADSARRGIRDDVSRSMFDLDERLAGLRSGLQVGRGSARAGGLSNIATHQLGHAEALSDIYRSKASYYGNMQTAAPTSFDFGGLGQAFDGFDWSSMFGGGGGAGSGWGPWRDDYGTG